MRLRYLKDPAEISDAEVKDFIARLNKTGDRGEVGPLYQTLAHSPTLFKGFLKFFQPMMNQLSLTNDYKELAMCRVAILNGAAFEWMHHAPLLKKAGFGDEAIETVRTVYPGYKGQDGEKGLGGKYWAVMRLVDAITKDIQVPDEVFEPVKKILDDRQILELGMPRTLTEFKIGRDKFDSLSENSLKDICTQHNPAKLDDGDIKAILEMCL